MKARCDFHIHSCLSPCASESMTPDAIVLRAIDRGLDAIALTDHNSARNCVALSDIAARENRIRILFGLEICTREEVHVLAIFDTAQKALDMDAFVEDALPDRGHEERFFGSQIVVDEDGQEVARVRKYLGAAAGFSVGEARDEIRRRGGLFIPSHIERGMFSMKSQLGFLPEDDYDAVEVSKAHYRTGGALTLKNAERYTRVTNSDAHELADIGSAYTVIDTEELTVTGLREALRAGRAVPRIF